jgi:hypothetical protein
MTTLSNIETILLDKYVVANNFTEFSEAHFYYALADIVPFWRLEQIAGQDRVYALETTEAYITYINQLTNDTTTNL